MNQYLKQFLQLGAFYLFLVVVFCICIYVLYALVYAVIMFLTALFNYVFMALILIAVLYLIYLKRKQ